jgi:hypothetical protein
MRDLNQTVVDQEIQILQVSIRKQMHSAQLRLVLRQFAEQHSNVEHVPVPVDAQP